MVLDLYQLKCSVIGKGDVPQIKYDIELMTMGVFWPLGFARVF